MPYDRSPRRGWAALGGALALHALGVLVTLATPELAKPASSGESRALPILAIDVEINDDAVTGTPNGLAYQGAPGDRPFATSANRGRDRAAAGQRVALASNDPVAPSGDYALDPNAPSTGEGRKIDLGIAPGDWSRWMDPNHNLEAPAPETTAPRRAPPPVSTTGGLAEALEAHDQGVGLGPAGTVLSAAREAGHSDVAPQLGKATFAITVLRTGAVEVQLTSASSNVDGWQKVAANMAATIKRKPPQINPPRNGARIGVELVAEERWPNGASTRSEGPSVTASGPSFRAVDVAKEDLATRNPAAIPPPGSPVEQPSLKANVDLPGVFLQGRGKVCSYKIGITPFGLGASGGCDPSNIGAPPQRVVSTRVVSESMF